MVKVTTANSFYNELRPSLVDFEYSEDNIDTVLQEVTVAVEAEAGTPVNGVAEVGLSAQPHHPHRHRDAR